MGDIAAVRDGLKVRLETIPNLLASTNPVDALDPPYAVVGEIKVSFDKAFGRGSDELEAKVRVYASRADVETGTDLLDGFLAGSGPTSVKAAIEGDRTLGGSADTLRVEAADGYGAYDVGATTYLGVEFIIRIWTKGATP